jgi:glycosyltransferase involved in cell wall biosynthesis
MGLVILLRAVMFNTAITAVMVTGKTIERYPLARGAVQSFLSQEYAGKKLLLIINDNPVPLYEDVRAIPDDVVELHINNPRELTLGELRNIAFDHVSPADYMVQWDDDDYSAPGRLQYQIDKTKSGTATVLRWQTQFDLRTGECFAGCGRMSRVKGFAGTMLFPASVKARFTLKPKGEDTDFLVALSREITLDVLANSPTDFLHFCHLNNTWHPEHVMRRRHGSRDLSAPELAVVRGIVRQHYTWAGGV